MSNLGKKLKELRDKKELSQQAVGKELGVSDVTIGRYERGERIPNIFIIKELSRIYGASIMEILDEDERNTIVKHSRLKIPANFKFDENFFNDYMFDCDRNGGYVLTDKTSNAIPKKYSADERKLETRCLDVDLSTLPELDIIGTVRAGVGGIAQEDVIGHEYAYTVNATKETHFYLKVKGDSMEPKISEGDLALVRRQSDVDSDDLAIVLVDNEEGVLKKVVKKPNSIELKSFNPYYPTRVFAGKEMNSIKIIGKVIKIISSW